MCGILGAYWRNPPIDARERMTLAVGDLHHRGPNDRGHDAFKIADQKDAALHLAHTRLSILDLSSAGHQPMRSPCGRYTVVFNGEIYNYRELRNELIGKGHRFATETDTEVLISAWAEWGTDCLRRFVGMFAFALHDAAKNILICVRDAFGIKPFFYFYQPESLYLFASEVGALLRLSGSKAAVNYQRVHDYLVHGLQDFPSDTFVAGVKHLPPAHVMEVDLCSGKINGLNLWWSPNILDTSNLSFADAAAHLRQLFLASVQLHLRSDVPVGASLSGGIDSSAIVCAMRRVEPDMPIHTLSYISDDKRISEETWIDLINNAVGAIPHKVHVQPNELMEDLTDLISAQGEPFNSTSMYAQYRLFKEAQASGVPVILEGQGADELLGGYQGYPGQRMRSMLESGRVLALLRFAKAWSANSDRNAKSPWRALVGQLLPEWLHASVHRAQLTDGTKAMLGGSELLKHCASTSTPDMGRRRSGYGNRLKEALAFSLTGQGLPSLLRFGDRNAMRFSVENRVPFLTVELVDFLFSIPEHYLVSDRGETKHLFRAAMRGIVPNQVLDRHDKIGFFTPMKEWINTSHRDFEQKIQESRCRHLLGWEPFFTEWKRFPQLRDSSTDLYWRAINLAYWADANEGIDWGVE